MPEAEQLRLQEIRKVLLIDAAALLRRKESIYLGNPEQFFAERGVSFFPIFKQLFQELYSFQVHKAVALGPRGGGKTFGAALLATAFFLFKDFDVGIVAGSETQALTLFGYITDWLDLAGAEEQFGDAVERVRCSDLVGKTGNRIVAKTASAKSIRGMHLGRGKRGALLIIDEEAETDEDVMRAARFVVRTAKPATILRMSTYHRLTGSFPNLVENHEELGYELYRWDSFDIAKPCPYECAACPVPEFRKRYCKGKAKRTHGWIDVAEIVGEWKDSSKEAFEVEIMGMRPASAGLVIAPSDLERAIDLGTRGYPAEFAHSFFCVDWGFAGMTAVAVLGWSAGKWFVRHTEMFSKQSIDTIVVSLKQLREDLGAREVYADASHPFENARLRDEGFAVWGKNLDSLGVPFVTFKEEGAAMLAYLFEKDLIGIPSQHHVLLKQFRSWRKDQAGHIVKKDDHFPDALIAGMQKVKQMGVGLGTRKARIVEGARRLFGLPSRIFKKGMW